MKDPAQRFLRKQIFLAWLFRDHAALHMYRYRLAAYRTAARRVGARNRKLGA
jgi:hypothetical protein